MGHRISFSGLIVDDKGREIGPAVDSHTIGKTPPMAGWSGLTIRLWNKVMTSGRDDLSQIDMKHNVQIHMQADDARALAHAILKELDQTKH